MKKMSWAAKEIGLLQIEAQERLLSEVLVQSELNLRPESPKSAWVFRDSMSTQLAILKEVRKELEATKPRKKHLLSSTILSIYKWATKDRFNF